MRGVAGQWALEVNVNGNDLGLDAKNISNFTIINNIHQHLPTISVGFQDRTGAHLNNLMNDGESISVSVGLPDNLYSNLGFRVMGPPSVAPVGGMNAIAFQGAFDNIGWMKKVIDKSYNGNSSDVISQIASSVGLIPDVDTTSDLMTWLPNRTTLAQYARHVADRSYASATSAMILAATDTGKLRYKSLDTLINSKSNAIFSETGEGFPILQYAATPKSLVANAAQGYGSTSIGVKEDGSIFEGNKVNLTMMSSVSSISSFFQEAIGELGSRINNLAPLSGNTHENWYQALHQNPRIKASYAYDIQLLTNVPTKLELLDTVDFIPINKATNKEAEQMAGKYIITAITKTIVQNRYFEKHVITSQSVGGV